MAMKISNSDIFSMLHLLVTSLTSGWVGMNIRYIIEVIGCRKLMAYNSSINEADCYWFSGKGIGEGWRSGF